jgi:hypothetical protein
VADTYTLIYQGQLPSSVATLFTVPGTPTAYIIKHWSVVNHDTVERTFTLYRGGTADTNRIVPAATVVPAGGMVEWDGTDCYGFDETFRGSASVASMLTLTVSGDKVS